ncbi:MAG: sigma-70 family RNA polymerase sigma factor [Colwellia sp.]
MLAYAKGDASAFEQLYAKHKLIVYRYFARQSLSVAVSEELAHDTWLKIINARESYTAKAKFTTYLFTIARHLMIDFQQKKSTRCEEVGLIADVLSVAVPLEKLLDKSLETPLKPVLEISCDITDEYYKKQALILALKQQIAQLPFDQRDVFLLKQESGFSIEEIANITQQNKEKVKSRWRYALQKLRKGLISYV